MELPDTRLVSRMLRASVIDVSSDRSMSSVMPNSFISAMVLSMVASSLSLFSLR